MYPSNIIDEMRRTNCKGAFSGSNSNTNSNTYCSCHCHFCKVFKDSTQNLPFSAEFYSKFCNFNINIVYKFVWATENKGKLQAFWVAGCTVAAKTRMLF